MSHPVLLVCRAGVYVTQRIATDNQRAETTYPCPTCTPLVFKELLRLFDIVSVYE